MKHTVAKDFGHNIISIKEDSGTIWTTAGTYTFGLSPLVCALIGIILWQRYRGSRGYH